MEIFNANNIASQAHAAQSKREDKRAERAKAGDHAERFRGYLDEAELDAEVDRVEMAEATRAIESNDQESAHEDREAGGFYDASGVEQADEAPRLDLEG
jgi:flagellar basal body rod protein FlgC